MQEEFDLSPEEVQTLFDNYPYCYRDRGIISHIYSSFEECGREEAENSCLFEVNSPWAQRTMQTYFDYEKFGEDIGQDEGYYTLDNERVVRFNM